MQNETVAPESSDNIAAGIGWMLLTMLLFVTMDTFAKFLTQTYPVNQVAWARFVFHIVWVSVYLGRSLKLYARSANVGLQFIRSILLVTTTGLFFTGLSVTPLPTASTIMFLSPLFVTVLAIPLLGEHVGWRRWVGVLVGFTGALIVIRPDTGNMAFGHLFLVCAALTNAVYQLFTRKARLYDPEKTTLLYSGIVGAVLCTLIAPVNWVPPDAQGWVIFSIVGLIGCVSHLCLIRAVKCAPASVVTPFSYSALLWAILFSYFIFDSLPDRWTLAGAALIIASGLYIFYRESVAKATDCD